MSTASNSIAERERAETAAAWAVRLAEKSMSTEQEDAFVAWIKDDPRNGEALEEIIGAWHSVETYATSAQVVALREAALASARRTLRKNGRSWWQRNAVVGMLAAALLVMIGGAGLWVWLTPQVYETGLGERRVVALSDGSKISLDAATRVKVSYSQDRRRLWLESGRAKFDVAKDRSRPFSVAAGEKVVVATGTAFSVELVQKQVRVVLYEGKVALFYRNGESAPPLTAAAISHASRLPAENLLKPGRELILPDRAEAPREPEAAVAITVDPISSLSWEAGQLVFEDVSLGVAVERMNRYAAKPLIVGDEGAASLRISGVFRAGDTDALVQGLAAAFDVQALSNPDATVLFRNKAIQHVR
jgi:transmembrane sensor